MLKIIIALCLGLFCHYYAYSQNLSYNPLLDSSVITLEKLKTDPDTEYIWYPGQLSAHLQQRRLQESQGRCVNVGYPGNYYGPVNKTYFKRICKLIAETIIEWRTVGKVTIYIDGEKITTTENKVTLPEGESTILYEVVTENDLPAIGITFNGKNSVDGWMASLDGNIWNYAENSPVYGKAGNAPLDDPEILVKIFPVSILPIRNATVDEKTIRINKNGYVLIDFFHIEVGRVTFAAKGRGNVTLFVGESPEEALNEISDYFEQHPIESYPLSETVKQIQLPERALRYIKIFCDEECEVSGVEFIAKVWPVEFQMSFNCSDERINNIWNASVASLHSCMHGFYLDGLKRDYLPWSMDAVVSTFAGDYLFGDKQVSRNSLSVALLPLNPEKSDLGIPDYPLHALVGFYHYYKRYDDFKTILSYRDRIEQLLTFYESIQDENGFISATVGGSWGFVPGWATRQGPDRKGTPTYAQIMLYYNYIIGIEFAKKWGDRNAARHYRNKAQDLKMSIIEHFWDEEQNLFLNGYTRDREIDKMISHHAQYWAIIAGIFSEDKYDNLFKILPQIPYYHDFVSFEKGYEFLAYSKARKVKEMWDFLIDVFGDWLEQGHSRFPENFSYKESKNEQLIFYRRPFGLSLAHGANGAPGVIAVLHGIAGFSQSETQLNHYTMQPDLINLEWANIEFPVKEGKIKLKLSLTGNSEIDIPPGCKVDVIDRNNKKISFSEKGKYRINY